MSPPDRTHLSSHAPGRHRDEEPGEQRPDEVARDAVFDYQEKNDRERQKTERSERCAGGVERGSLLSAAPAVEARLSIRRISCFSTRVALAQKMAGRPRKSPPTEAP